MAPPSQITIAISSLQRLVKEEGSYHKELKQQEARLEKLLASKDEDENAEFQLKQERQAIEETKAIFPPLRQRIADALQKLEDRLESGDATEAETAKANEIIKLAEEATSAN